MNIMTSMTPERLSAEALGDCSIMKTFIDVEQVKKSGRIRRYMDKQHNIAAFMCPHCYDVFYKEMREYHEIELTDNFMPYSDPRSVNIRPDVNTTFYIDKCPNCNEYYVDLIQLDWTLAPVIQALNKKGYKTKNCCAGHWNEVNTGTIPDIDEIRIYDNYEEPYILFDYNIDILDLCMHDLPLHWNVDINHTAAWGAIRIYADYPEKFEYSLEYISELLVWALALPDIPEECKIEAKYCRLKEYEESDDIILVPYTNSRFGKPYRTELR